MVVVVNGRHRLIIPDPNSAKYGVPSASIAIWPENPTVNSEQIFCLSPDDDILTINEEALGL